MTGQCHCGKNSISIPRRPAFLYCCNCSLCRKSGGLWGYFPAEGVTFSGATASYRRIDKDIAKGALHFCDQCGNTTHWISDTDAGDWTCAVNMRLFDPAALTGIPIYYPDGANWSGNGAFDFVRDPEIHSGISH
ncbi:MAG: GFA family protein [Sphingorhabdus sp.]